MFIMANTSSINVDNLSMHAITAPVWCKTLTIRQTASDITQVEYDIAAPSATATAFRKNQGEETIFGSGPQAQNAIQSGNIVGYIQPTSGTVTYTIICEP